MERAKTSPRRQSTTMDGDKNLSRRLRHWRHTETNAAIGLNVSVPYCVSRCLCCARDVAVAQATAEIDRYVRALLVHSERLSRAAGPHAEVVRLLMGGGSAGELSDRQIVELVSGLRSHWRLPADAELSVECDPRTVGWGQLRCLALEGFDRIVLGVLELDPAVQRAIGRSQSPQQLGDVCDRARACPFDCIEISLMTGLPAQSVDGWRATLRSVVAIGPDRVSLKRYAHRPRQIGLQAAIAADVLPDAARCRQLEAVALSELMTAGYRCLDDGFFVLDTDRLLMADEPGDLRRDLLDRTVAAPVPVLGLGAGARGEIGGWRYRNVQQLPAWHEAVAAGGLAVAGSSADAANAPIDLTPAPADTGHWPRRTTFGVCPVNSGRLGICQG